MQEVEITGYLIVGRASSEFLRRASPTVIAMSGKRYPPEENTRYDDINDTYLHLSLCVSGDYVTSYL